MRRAAMLLSAVTVSAATAADAAGGAFAPYPNVTIRHYNVAGADAPTIRAAINTARPKQTVDGKRYDARSDWFLDWKWTTGGSPCRVTSVKISFRATVTLPRLTTRDRLPAPLHARWDRYMAALEAHEAGHLQNAHSRMEEVRRAIAAAPCANPNAAGKAAITRINRIDADYDRVTNHGIRNGATFP